MKYKIFGIMIALIFIPILAFIAVFIANNAVFFDFYDGGFNYYNINDTTMAMCKDHPSVEKTFYINSQVKRLNNLQSLELYADPYYSLKFLKDFKSLEKLELDAFSSYDASTLDTLPALPDLKYIRLVCYEKDDLDCSPLGQLTSLEELATFNVNIQDWSFTDNLPHLRRIHIFHDYYRNDSFLKKSSLFDWTGLASAAGLEEFEAFNVIYDRAMLDALESIQSLNTVTIRFNFYEKDESEYPYIHDWIERMTEKGVSCKIYDFNDDKDGSSAD